MDCFKRNFVKILCVIFVFYFVKVEPAHPPDMTWPVTLSFHETKTNALLGEALLKRVYARIGFTDNIIRAEVDTLFENLKEVIDKKLRNCERRRRRGSRSHYDTVYNSNGHGIYNSTYPSQYGQRRY